MPKRTSAGRHLSARSPAQQPTGRFDEDAEQDPSLPDMLGASTLDADTSDDETGSGESADGSDDDGPSESEDDKADFEDDASGDDSDDSEDVDAAVLQYADAVASAQQASAAADIRPDSR